MRHDIRNITALLLILCAGSAHSQSLKEADVPSEVKNSLKQRFPDAKGVKWSKETDTEFEAEFKTKGVEQSANFDQRGEWLVTETEIKGVAIPQIVQTTIARDFSGYKINEAEKGETPTGVFYEVELTKNGKTKEVEFSESGELMKKEEK